MTNESCKCGHPRYAHYTNPNPALLNGRACSDCEHCKQFESAQTPGYVTFYEAGKALSQGLSFQPAVMPAWFKAALDKPVSPYLNRESAPGKPADVKSKIHTYTFGVDMAQKPITHMSMSWPNESGFSLTVQWSVKIKRSPVAVAQDIRQTHNELGDLELERAKARAAYLEAERRIGAAEGRLEKLQAELDEAEAE